MIDTFFLIGLLRGVALNTDGYTRRSPAHGLQLEFLAEARASSFIYM